jgi:ABC-2 type transport system permease protein
MPLAGHCDPSSDAAAQRIAALGAQELRVVTPDAGFLSGAKASLLDLWHHRQLWLLLTRRELKARYKDSVLGFVWTLIRPLINLLIYYFVIGKVLGAWRSIDNFAVYVFAGLTAWTLFSQIIATSTASIIANVGIVKKVYLPREIFPLASSGAAFVDFLAQLAILFIGALLMIGHFDGEAFVVYGPISLLVLLTWGIALGLLLAAVNVYLRDVQYLVEVLLMIGFWLTPSVYSFEMILENTPRWLPDLYLLNPTAVAVMGFQKAFWGVGSPEAIWPSDLLPRLGVMLLLGIILTFVAQRVFARLQRNFAQEI